MVYSRSFEGLNPMEITDVKPPRRFKGKTVEIRHCANITLEPDEQITFETESGTEYDVVRKSWGYYATPSINGRLKEHGLRGVLVKNSVGRIYLLLIEQGKEADFEQYLIQEEMMVIMWLDGSSNFQV